jgi:Family of unknown function (DUF5899)
MEIAIPGVALGLLYIVSNQKSKKENFRDRSQLPNVDVPNRNYPGELPVISTDSDLTSQLSTTNHYDNGGGVYTDKYFNPNMNKQTDENKPVGQQFYSLTGDKVNASYFEHNNMVPFFGSNLRTRIADENSHEGIMDSYTGSGSQIIRKKEQAPLFSPSGNQQWAFGAPNMSEFYQSRVNPSMRMANVKPFEEEHVAPGLGLGYTTEGSGGFNSGMMMRDKWLDKTADQLRVDNKPKATGLMLYGHEGPADSAIKMNATYEQMGVMEKHLPEQSFALDTRSASNPHDIGRLFTTGGVEKGQTMRAIPVDRYVSRPETAVSYAGGAGYQNEASYIPGEYMPTHNQQLGALPFAVANANGRQYATDADYEVKAKKAYPNNRTSNKQDNYFGMVGGSLGAAVAPLLDMLRPSRKENVLGTLRPYQNPSTSVPQSYIFNPADRPAATIRETTEKSINHLNVSNTHTDGAYHVTGHNPTYTNRTDTDDFFYSGGSSAGERGRQPMSYVSGYNQRNNDIKASTIDGYMVQGNMSLLNSDINMRQVSRDNILKNERGVIATMPYQSPDVMNMGRTAGTSNNLYANINMDRNSSDITSMLKSNPYVVDYRKAL